MEQVDYYEEKESMRKKLSLKSYILLCAILLTGCGNNHVVNTVHTEPGTKAITLAVTEQVTQPPSPTSIPIEDNNENPKQDKESRLITEQSFTVNLPQLGEVEFASYRPDITENKTLDVIFELKKEGKLLATLEGMEENNIRSGIIFQSVEAVSFSDYNSDGNKDILIICKYEKELESGQSENTSKEEYVEARIYKGSAEGTFTLEKQLSKDTNSAVAILTIQSILGFLNVGDKDTYGESTAWKEAYANTVINDISKEYISGYQLIYVNDDDIPELVIVGVDEASGCSILNYDEGQVCEIGLSRLSFTYIERQNLLCNSEGHMGYYYDDIYRMEDGQFVLLGGGTYENPGEFEAVYDEYGYLVPDDTFTFTWNGVECSKEEYQQNFKEIYDMSKAKPGYEYGGLLSQEELLNFLQDRNTN